MVEENDSRKQSNPVLMFLLAGVILFVLYLASPIPVAFALNCSAMRGHFPPALNKIYKPIGWAHDHTSMRKPIENYGRFISGL